MKKKFLALVLCLSLLLVQFSMVFVSAEVDTAAIYDTTTATYTVSNADELIAVVAEINSAEENYGRNITLSADIDLTGKAFTPLATYSGVFDGANKTITGLVLTAETGDIGFIVNGAGCTVKNLILDGAVIVGGQNVAGLIAVSGTKTVEEDVVDAAVSNCKVVNSVITTVGGAVGGIVGTAGTSSAAASVTIENCSVVDSHLATTNIVVGGIVGVTYGTATITGCIVDLDLAKTIVVGETPYAPSIISAHNKASSPDGHAGGIVGQPKKAVTIDRCAVYGEISSKKYAGGVTGQAAGGATITNCLVDVNMKSTNYGAGIVAGESGTNTYTITNCFTAGDYQITSNPAGGIVGYSSGDTWIVTNCVSVATFSGAKGGASIFGSTKKCTYDVKDCIGITSFFGTLTVDGKTTITESGSKIVGTEEVAMVSKLTYNAGQQLLINEVVYTDTSDPTAEAAVAAFKAPAVAEADLLALVAEKFAAVDDPATEDVDEKALADAFIKEVQVCILCANVADLYDAATKTYTVSTADELIDVINAINAGYADRNITLAADIDLTGKTVAPIETYSATFDGGNKTIKGLTLVAAGLIANGTDCTVKNLVIDGANVSNNATGVGSVIGVASGTVVVDNCELKNSTVTGSTTSVSRVGGFIGYAASKSNVTVSNCSVENSTITSGKEIVGGIAGYADSAKTFNIINCTVEATLSGTAYVGGIVGRTAGTPAVYKNCAVDANIVSGNSAGGIAGGESGGNASNVITFENCFVAGVYQNTGSNPKRSGGIIGYASSDTIIFKNCVSIADCDAAIAGNPNKNVITMENCVGDRAFIALMTVSDTFKITESGSKILGTEEALLIGASSLTEGKKLTINGTEYATQDEINAAVAAFKATAGGEKLDLIKVKIDEMFAAQDDPATEGVDEKALADAFIADAKTVATAHTLKVLGYQTKDEGNDTYDIRFVAYIESTNYDSAGFEITAKIDGQDKTATYDVKAVYEEIYATIGDETTVLTVDKLGNYTDGYILAVKVTGVPKTVTEFSVTPYVKTVGTGELFKGLSGTASVEFSAN